MLPATLLGLLTGSPAGEALDLGVLGGRYEHVVLIYFDAFGWKWYERHDSHALLRRAASQGQVRQLTSQFPSTTAAHMTTIHSGQPVGIHGVYEWFTLLPSANRIVAPLLFSFAGDDRPGTLLAEGIRPGDIYPAGDFYPALRAAGVDAHVSFPTEIAAGPPGQALHGQANVLAFQEVGDGLDALGAALAASERGYGFMYLPDVDSLMHHRGPEHPEVDLLIDATLDALEGGLARGALPKGTLVLITADHGMAPVSPERTLFVNELWPELVDHLAVGADGRPLAPAGSSRDLFLHTQPGHREEVRAGLAERLEGAAQVCAVDELIARGVFGPRTSERFRERVGDLVVLPQFGEAVYWREPPRFGQPYHGQHGGLSPQEIEIPLIAFAV
jgi:predicted AlkP superfamily pyrophosphatase or phosphodiesterase